LLEIADCSHGIEFIDIQRESKSVDEGLKLKVSTVDITFFEKNTLLYSILLQSAEINVHRRLYSELQRVIQNYKNHIQRDT